MWVKTYSWILIPIISFLFLSEMILENKIPMASDTISHEPIKQWKKLSLSRNIGHPQWYPDLFSGIPAYGGYINTAGNPLASFINMIFFNRGLKYWFYFSIGGCGLLLFLLRIKIGSIPALFGGLSFSLTPYMFGLINAGHSSKIIAISYLPWVFLAAHMVTDKRDIKSIFFLSLASAFQLWSNHPQIVYYTWMLIIFWWIWNVGSDLKENIFKPKKSFIQLTSIVAGLLLALLIVSDPYADVYSFQSHSNRGSPSVLDNTKETNSGTKWDYATGWSFHPKELTSFFYPFAYGLQNFSTRDIKSAAYWGYMPFTQSTHYIGLLVLLLAILGALISKPDRLDWFLWTTSGLTLLIGFGSYFPIFYKVLYDWAPFFSKFRIPSMIYILLAFTFPVLAARAMEKVLLLNGNPTRFHKVIWALCSFIFLSLILFLFPDSLISFNNSGDVRFNPSILSQIRTFRIELFQKGMFLALGISISVLALIWVSVRGMISNSVCGIIFILISIVDLLVVDREFLNLKKTIAMERNFVKTKIVDILQNDKDFFRIFPADNLNTNKYGYWGIESIGGYRPVKLRNYQDLMDAKGFSRPHILNMLNVKYVITRKKINNVDFIMEKTIPGIYTNTKVLPRAWIVGDIKTVSSERESLTETLSNQFDPSNSAIVMNYNNEDFPENCDGKVTIISKTENRIELVSESQTGGLLVLSEVYYKPGWNAFINNVETKIYQTNHILRSVRIPSGRSTVVFQYNTNLWRITRFLSKTSFFAILFGLGLVFWKEEKKKNSLKIK